MLRKSVQKITRRCERLYDWLSCSSGVGRVQNLLKNVCDWMFGPLHLEQKERCVCGEGMGGVVVFG
jgi:hypothetical protein